MSQNSRHVLRVVRPPPCHVGTPISDSPSPSPSPPTSPPKLSHIPGLPSGGQAHYARSGAAVSHIRPPYDWGRPAPAWCGQNCLVALRGVAG